MHLLSKGTYLIRAVVVDRSEYDGKLEDMLTDDTYRKLKRDPTARIEREVAKALKETEDKGEMPKEKRLFLTLHASHPNSTGSPKSTRKILHSEPVCRRSVHQLTSEQ